jgi:hypothetical protein
LRRYEQFRRSFVEYVSCTHSHRKEHLVDNKDPLLPAHSLIEALSSGTVPSRRGIFSTRDHAVIRQWAASRDAQPATGEATRTGPQTVDVNDGDASIRFNFPGAAPFRSISWSEWFDHFDRHLLTFVFEHLGSQSLSNRCRIVKTKDLSTFSTTVPMVSNR